MDRRSELPNPRKGRFSSKLDEQQIPFLRYGDELGSGERPAIWSFEKERTAFEIRWQREHPHTGYSPRNPLRSPHPPSETHLMEAIHQSGSGGHDLHGPHERSPQGGPSASCFHNNGRIMGKTG